MVPVGGAIVAGPSSTLVDKAWGPSMTQRLTVWTVVVPEQLRCQGYIRGVHP